MEIISLTPATPGLPYAISKAVTGFTERPTASLVIKETPTATALPYEEAQIGITKDPAFRTGWIVAVSLKAAPSRPLWIELIVNGIRYAGGWLKPINF